MSYNGDYDSDDYYHGRTGRKEVGHYYNNYNCDVLTTHEFNFDQDRPMFEYDPFTEYSDLKVESDKVMMTFQALGNLAEMTARLLKAWEKRAKAGHSKRQDLIAEKFRSYTRTLNLYQLGDDERRDLQAYSVWHLQQVLGGSEEVMKLKEAAVQISKFVNGIILALLEKSFPHTMPYPVMTTILSNLLSVKGAGNLGLVSSIDEGKEVERKTMEEIYLPMADIFEVAKEVMFYTDPMDTYETESSIIYIERQAIIGRKFEMLVSTVNSSQLQIRVDGMGVKDVEA